MSENQRHLKHNGD